MRFNVAIVFVTTLLASASAAQEAESVSQIAEALKKISPHVAAEAERDQLRGMLGRSLREQIAAGNRASSEAWGKIQSREDWERFRAEKLALLRKSLGTLPPRPARPKTLVTGRIDGDGFQIQNLVYESRPGLVVTANLYVPVPARDKMPGIAIAHSHHNPKWEGELQDMGMTWARAGCYVLVPDALGHGERRQHPFAAAADYSQEFPVSRQDYNFRYDTSLQLYLAGETLMGWMAHDLMTGFDVLVNQPGIDDTRLILLGSVAGGGDPCGVTGALDERIDCIVPFNFGGPQPENRYPLPADAETSFNYAGGGSWESTRNLYRSAVDGFLPWVIVGSVAPRKLIHAHEFSWDRERDPVWKRYEKIYGLYGAKDNLAFTTGFGTIQNTQAPASHCNNIGPPHRKLIHEALGKWFGIKVTPESEYKNRRTREELTCLTDEARKQFQPKLLHELLAKMADQQLAAAQKSRAAMKPDERRDQMRDVWTRLLSDTEPPKEIKVRDGSPATEQVGGVTVRRELLETAPGISVPLMTLSLSRLDDRKDRSRFAILGLAGDGLQAALPRRNKDIAEGLLAGCVIALVDVRGLGAAGSEQDRGQQSSSTGHSATQLMLGQTMLGGQLRDLRAAWQHLQRREDVSRNVVIAGGSGREPLAADAEFKYPRRVDRPAESQPEAALLSLLFGLYEPASTVIVSRHGLVSYRSILDSPFVQAPHAAIVPGALQLVDLPDLAVVLAPREVVLDVLVDGRGRLIPKAVAEATYEAAARANTGSERPASLQISETDSPLVGRQP
ncbi:MAG TPA: hypothetical protein VFB80_20935 [Pirellulaceae bacterium]|nr:hypothetical protein [Pirellulaceae bacterium]